MIVRPRTSIIALCTAILAGVLTSCGGGGSDSQCGGIIEPTRTISVTPTTIVLDPGVDTLVTASVNGGCATDDRTIRWLATDPAIATVDGSGKISGISSGSTTIVASTFSDRATARIPVTVKPRVPTTLALAPKVDTLSPLGTRPLTPTVRDQTGTLVTGAAISYRSLTPNFASVTNTGVVNAIAAGTALIEGAVLKAGTDSLRDTVRVVIITACSLIRPLQLGTTVSGAIDASSCQNFQGYRVVNQYSITSTSQVYASLRLTPTGTMALVPLIVSGSTHGLPTADTAVTAYMVARAGTTNLLATAPAITSVPYTLSTAVDPDPKTACVTTDVTLNVSFRTAITPTCLGRDIRILPPLTIGQVIRVTGVSAGFPVTLELRNAPSNTLLQRSVASAAGGQATIAYTNGLAAQLVRVRVIGPAAANDYVTISVSP